MKLARESISLQGDQKVHSLLPKGNYTNALGSTQNIGVHCVMTKI